MTSWRALFPRSLRGAASIRNISRLALLAALGCGGGQTGDEQTGNAGSVLQELRGTATRVAASTTFPNSASDDTWDFGWKLYRQEAKPTENAFFSPYSISVASAMLVKGAGGQTKTEIDSALSFSNDDGDAFHQARNSVAQALAARNHAATERYNAQALRVSNGLWLRPTFRPAPAFLDTLSAYYDAGVFLAPFDSDPEAARAAINEKVAGDTERLIPELLPPRSIDENVAFVLTNALYFKSNWANQFSPGLTRDEPFVRATGATANVPMMHATFETGYRAGPDYQIIRLPYFGSELELVAIMPSAGTFAGFVGQLNAETVATVSSGLTSVNVELGFPRLGITSTVPLKERLQGLGMHLAFEPGADFDEQLGPLVFISEAFHQATITLDEEGTEAAAATAIVGVDQSAPPPPIPVTFDHPFIFFIRDIQTNALLFVGQFTGP
ncbi:MAG: serpin family protein [Deltaproteobacteria bacterium]